MSGKRQESSQPVKDPVVAWAQTGVLAALVLLAWLATELVVEAQEGPEEEKEVSSARKGGRSDVTIPITSG